MRAGGFVRSRRPRPSPSAHRAEPTTSPETELGLWFTRSIVENHRGTIELRSRAGDGTRWTIWLPGWED